MIRLGDKCDKSYLAISSYPTGRDTVTDCSDRTGNYGPGPFSFRYSFF